MEKEARTKLAEKPIHWEEKYTEHTKELKRKYTDIIGKGCYFRWEGTDADTGDKYVCIVGPSGVKDPEPKFFAGVRKLPSDWPAGGESFSEMKEAMEKAMETWGIPLPSKIVYYDASDLKGIAKRIEKWEEEHRKEANMKQEHIYVSTNTYPFYQKVSMEAYAMGATRWTGRQGYQCFDVDTIASDQMFNNLIEEEEEKGTGMENALLQAKAEAVGERNRRKAYIAEKYGAEYATANAGMYHTWLIYNPADYGLYIFSIGPYCGNYFGQAVDKFGIFTKHLNVASQDAIDRKTQEIQEVYANRWGVTLDPATDLMRPNAGEVKKGMAIVISPQGKQKVKNTNQWKKWVQFWGIDTTQKGWMSKWAELYKQFNEPQSKLRQNYDKAYQTQLQNALNSSALDAAYKEKLKSGEAFLEDMPPPPDPSWKPHRIGQQIFSTILRETPANEAVAVAPKTKGKKSKDQKEIEQAEKFMQYGFDSVHEAIQFLKSKHYKSVPIPDNVINVTSKDLKKARDEKKAKDDAAATGGRSQSTQVKPEKTPVAPFKKKTPDVDPVAKAPRTDIPENTGSDQNLVDVAPGGSIPGFDDDEVTSESVKKLIALAETYDSKGLYSNAEAIHTILRKFFKM